MTISFRPKPSFQPHRFQSLTFVNKVAATVVPELAISSFEDAAN